MTWLDEAHGLCDELLGGSVPVYIRLAHGRPHLQWHVAAFTGTDSDLRLYPELVESGQWQGRGFGCIIVREWPEASPAYEHTNISTALHELAHWVLFDAQPAVEDLPVGTLEGIMSSDCQATWDKYVWDTLKQQARAGKPLRGPVPWLHHEWPFWRMVCHVASRVRRLGLPYWPIHLGDSADYGLSPIDSYVEVLRDELDEKHDSGLIEIARTPPPAALVELFQRDTLRHTCVPLVVAR